MSIISIAPPAGRRRVARRLRGARLIRRHWDRVRARWARQRTLRALAALDRATLRDLGITEIESVVYGSGQDSRRGYDPDWWRRM